MGIVILLTTGADFLGRDALADHLGASRAEFVARRQGQEAGLAILVDLPIDDALEVFGIDDLQKLQLCAGRPRTLHRLAIFVQASESNRGLLLLLLSLAGILEDSQLDTLQLRQMTLTLALTLRAPGAFIARTRTISGLFDLTNLFHRLLTYVLLKRAFRYSFGIPYGTHSGKAGTSSKQLRNFSAAGAAVVIDRIVDCRELHDGRSFWE